MYLILNIICVFHASSTTLACSDRINLNSGTSDCPSLAYLCNNSIYFTLMTKQCPLTCGRCTSTTSAATSTCVDRVNPSTAISDCPSLAYFCDNTLYRTLMTEQCPLTCGRCNEQTILATSAGCSPTNPTTISTTTTGVDPTAVVAIIPFQPGSTMRPPASATTVTGLTRTGIKIGDPSDLTGLTWIGLRRVDGDFAWTDGTPVDFVTWQATQPDDHGAGEDCVQTYSDFINGTPDEPYYRRWNDYRCQEVMRAYVCKNQPSLYVRLANGNIVNV